MQLEIRPQRILIDEYKGYRIVLNHGRFYGALTEEEANELGSTCGLQPWHTKVLNAGTQEELLTLIDDTVARHSDPVPLGTHLGYDLFSHRDTVWAVPQGRGSIDLDIEEECQRLGVLSAPNVEALREKVDATVRCIPVEFAGWLPVFNGAGNCGQHPQFKHMNVPPAGYRFIQSVPPEVDEDTPPRGLARLGAWAAACSRAVGQVAGWAGGRLRKLWLMVQPLFAFFQRGQDVSFRDRLRLLAAIVRLYRVLRRGGGRLGDVLLFLRSRNFSSQVMLAGRRELVFLTSVPYTFSQSPWVIEIEDPTMLFFPFIQNGGTRNLKIQESRYFPLVRAMLESDECKGILTHIRSTARMIPGLFQSETITKKVFYAPLGVQLPDRWQRHDQEEGEIRLLYTTSWHQQSAGFHCRGGLDLLEAFAILRRRFPQLRLTMRTNLPKMDSHYHRLIDDNWVRVIDRFLTTEEMVALHADSHLYLLPSARIHVVSLLQAMSHGLAVVASDGWGVEEYLDHERNGLVVRGRLGVTSWPDEKAGVLREDYSWTVHPDPVVVDGIVQAVTRLVEDRALRRQLGHTARHDVETRYNLDRWNQALKNVFDQAVGRPVC
jgi:glycosyltransferase involved in cell wall biosynthesis